ncbi:integrase catalytic domain-containing protein [Trichonephila clavipes]|nr:integrase catalytic domain-containing protein [Trichonephila clavipes]
MSTHESDESFDIYMKYKDILFNWAVDLEQKSQVEELNNSIHVKSSVVNLPKLEVLHFYGNCENWISFKELFKSSILDNKSISDLESGDAAKLIRGFVITADNLKNCWDILCSRQRWELSVENNKIPTLEEFRVFFEREARGLNELKFVKPDIKKGNVKPLNSFNKSNVNSTVVKCNQVKSGNHSLKQFWELESVPKDIPSKNEDELCESIFVNSHIRNADGKYILKLPFRDYSSLGDSKEGAVKRFYSLERKLHSNNHLKEQYTEFMEEYQNLGHMTHLTSDVKSPHYFLPHHGVINDNSSTTKLRMVFDGSFKSANGNSLSDILLTGKKLQSNIFVTLLKFRFFTIAFSADIAKMYRQILISQDDVCFQQIFWRKSPERPLGIFKLNTVTYGTSCASFLTI